jgi:NAD+ synthase (glutamine-hydrolysing)
LRFDQIYTGFFCTFAIAKCSPLLAINMNNGFFRVAAAVPTVAVANPAANAAAIISQIMELNGRGVNLAVFPELSVTGYTCGDLFHSSLLLDAADKALAEIAESTARCAMLVVVGAPIRYNNALYNCAVAMAGGRIVAIIPKTYLPNYNEFYEKRLWTSGNGVNAVVMGAPFTAKQLIEFEGVKIGAEVCEDLWTPIPPSSTAALMGAQIVVNLSASDDIIGKYDYLKSLIAQQSARCLCGYVYASAGFGESSTDLVFDGKAIIAENGSILGVNDRWQGGSQFVVCDVDVEALNRDRMHLGSFTDSAVNAGALSSPYAIVKAEVSETCEAVEHDAFELLRTVNPHPFVPATNRDVDLRCEEIINIQVAGLARRLDATHCSTLVVGISGGLDSTLALLVATKAFDRLNLLRTGIIGVTMPGFGTTGRTHSNALTLMAGLGVTSREISIAAAVTQHFSDIGHDASVHDVTYENSQARERTQLLMDIANKEGGMVLGTGDLSELALGWATYNGDHMSMYGVNASVPKTLVKFLVRWFAMRTNNKKVANALIDIIDTPISPELIPADEHGNIKQKTEDLVGPYELHDFFLYYTLRYGFSPKRIYMLARHAFPCDSQLDLFEDNRQAAGEGLPVGCYTDDTLKHWLRVFFRRFFNQQFKRSCMPDGPKVGSVCLSPRGDWRMPSDASSQLWLQEIDEL